MYYKLYYTKVKFGQFWKNWFGTRTEEKQWHALPTALDESLKKKKKHQTRSPHPKASLLEIQLKTWKWRNQVLSNKAEHLTE